MLFAKRQLAYKPGLANHFWGRVTKLSINFEEILSRAHDNFEEQNKVLEPYIIIINYLIIKYCIINAYYKCIV